MNDKENKPRISGMALYLPLAIFALIAMFFVIGLKNGGGSRDLPSALIGKSIEFSLIPMEGLRHPGGGPMPSFSSKDLKKGHVSIVNVWSSWCGTCRFEHKFLKKLAQKGKVPLYGMNYKDTASAGRAFLDQYGNPYDAVGMDPKGRVGIDLGVYGVPETFIFDGNGVLRFKLSGPVDDQIIEKKLLPAIKKAQAATRRPKQPSS